MFKRIVFFWFLALAGMAHAQEPARTILVLDASGSMWGQIDGTAKITIAQDVISGLLKSLPVDQELGLTVYGHRTKGDCRDIETIVAPGKGTRQAIADAVAAIKPKGKTPLSDAVVAAAEALRYTEEKATVILVSDGKETCQVNTCEVGQRLEATGVDFTAHVIGFDIDDPIVQAELKCLAENTGGTFLTASNAAELTQALAVVAEPAPVPVTVNFRAIEGEDGPEYTGMLIWDIFRDDAAVGNTLQGPTVSADLLSGAYRVEALRPDDELNAEATFLLEDATMTVTVVFPAPIPEATLEAAAQAPAGSLLDVSWSGPDEKGDFITVAKPDTDRYIHYGYTKTGNPTEVRMPPLPGSYELRYIQNTGNRVLARRMIEITPLNITLDAPESIPLGDTLLVGYEGPNYKGDYIAVAPIDPEERYINYGYTKSGNPTKVLMPPRTGEFELRYVLGASNTVVARKPIIVTETEFTVDAPDQAAVGASVDVGWEGPAYRGDYIAVSQIDDDGYVTYSYVKTGNPTAVKMPLDPGNYELRYVLAQGNTIMARRAISVVDVMVDLMLVDSAPAGSNVVVNWDGPGYDGDYISVAVPGDDRYINYTYARDGSPLILRLPVQPGDYEVRYVASGNGESVLATKTITLAPVSASIEAAGEVPAGGNLAIVWQGPGYRGDYIAITKKGEDKYRSYVYTSENSPIVMEMPEGPGEYELRYHLGQDDSVLATRAVKLTYQE